MKGKQRNYYLLRNPSQLMKMKKEKLKTESQSQNSKTKKMNVIISKIEFKKSMMTLKQMLKNVFSERSKLFKSRLRKEESFYLRKRENSEKNGDSLRKKENLSSLIGKNIS